MGMIDNVTVERLGRFLDLTAYRASLIAGNMANVDTPGLAGGLCGVLSLRCSGDTATLIVQRMLGEGAEDVEQQRWDALGEICNMIAGNFKDKLTGVGYRCLLSVPTVVTGTNYRIHPLAGSRSVDVHLLFEDRPVELLLEVHN